MCDAKLHAVPIVASVVHLHWLCCRVHVVFGHVIEGQDVVRKIEDQKVDDNSRPLADVKISSCGELVLQVRPKGTVSVCSLIL